MKKNGKRVFAIMLVALQIFLLCGCTALDEMRKNQAFYGEDGNIVWNGNVYKKLPESAYFYPETDYNTMVNVTEADVPVLLSGMFGLAYYYPSADGVFLEDHAEDIYYCEMSVYTQIRDRILGTFEPEIVCYSYYMYDEEAHEMEARYYTLTQEQVDAVFYVVENVEPTILQEGMSLDCDLSVYLEECSEDMLFRKETMDISRSGSTFYVHQYTDAGTQLFTVPQEYNAVFAKIVEDYQLNGVY